MIATAMTPTELRAECLRIAAIVGEKGRCYIALSSEYPPSLAVAQGNAMADHFKGPGWPEMFAQAEARARELSMRSHAGDIEFDSWFEPQLMAAE